jgi:threonine dehydrogenase-like Zn-dependent dehydrogenase
MLMTAAGTIQPARVLILGAGVAGLQALATARRLGAVVYVSDVRAAAKEQVESLGGRFLDPPSEQDLPSEKGGYATKRSEAFLAAQRKQLAEQLALADMVICTAQVPGRPAPRLISEDMLDRLRPGSVVVDLAVAQGGNCAGTVPGETVIRSGVRADRSGSPSELRTRPCQCALCPQRCSLDGASGAMKKGVFASTSTIRSWRPASSPTPEPVAAMTCVQTAPPLLAAGTAS